jgi:hypothetical protein
VGKTILSLLKGSAASQFEHQEHVGEGMLAKLCTATTSFIMSPASLPIRTEQLGYH